MRSWLIAAAAAIVVIGLILADFIYFVFWGQFVPIAAMGINYARYLNAPAGTIATEANADWKTAMTPATAPTSPAPAEGDWPSYNKTLTSNRFSQLQPDQHAKCRRAEGSVHLRHRPIYRLHIPGCSRSNGALIAVDRIRYLLDRPGRLPPELAHARGLHARLAAGRQSRRGLYGRQAVSRHPGRPRAGL